MNFAVVAADKPMAAKNTARFNLMVEDMGGKPWIYFMMADLEETDGVKVPTQHYDQAFGTGRASVLK